MQPRPIAETTSPPVQVFAVSCLLNFACHLHRGRKIVRHRGFKTFPVTGVWVSKPKFPGMQHLSREILCRACRVNFVAEHRMTEVVKMHTNLVSASAVQPALDQAGLIS